MGFEIDIDTAIENATTEENFDVLEFIAGSATPEHVVTLYTDADAALKTARLIVAEEERNARDKEDDWSIADTFDEEQENLSEEQLTELHDRLVASALDFNLKGLAPAALDALEKSLRAKHEYKEDGDNPEYNKALELELVARSIVSVTNKASGKVSKAKWTTAQIEKLFVGLYPSETNKLLNGVVQINYVAAIFDKAVTADFS